MCNKVSLQKVDWNKDFYDDLSRFRGTYGYVDPDGNKREYHYETGIKCDPNRRDETDEFQENSFVNYEDNKAVLPNGIEIDMSQLGKKKSKRPGVNYRN